jgi:predicted nucleic acid-binding protein
MNGWLLDTNALSKLRRPSDNRSLVDFMSVQPRTTLFTSALCIAEIRHGIELKEDPEVRADLSAWLEHIVRPQFQERVLEADEDALLRWVMIIRSGHERGHHFPGQDSLIAAIAADQQMVVVTQDETHFVAAGVPVLDPWTSQYHANGNSYLVPNLVSATLLSELPG